MHTADNTQTGAQPSGGPPPVRAGRGNAILTYREVEAMHIALVRLDMKMDVVSDSQLKMGELMNNDLADHEARIRALEVGFGAQTTRGAVASWAFHALWPIAAVTISALAYFKP